MFCTLFRQQKKSPGRHVDAGRGICVVVIGADRSYRTDMANIIYDLWSYTTDMAHRRTAIFQSFNIRKIFQY